MLRKNCPCDLDGICPYDAEFMRDCEAYCGDDREDEFPEDYDYEMGFDPYMGCYTDDC